MNLTRVGHICMFVHQMKDFKYQTDNQIDFKLLGRILASVTKKTLKLSVPIRTIYWMFKNGQRNGNDIESLCENWQ